MFEAMSSLAIADYVGALPKDNEPCARQLPMRLPGMKKYSKSNLFSFRDIWKIWRVLGSW